MVIPAYRVTEYIATTLDSVFAQTFDRYEVIVVNDGCPDTDSLERVLAPYRDRILYVKQENQGVSAARNAGILRASAPLVALLDSDDAWEPTYLAVHVGMMESDPTLSVAYPDSVLFGDSSDAGKLQSDLSPVRTEVTFENLVLMKCQVVTSAVIRLEVLRQAGLFDPSLRRAEDFDLWLRIAKMGGKFACSGQPLLRYRRRSSSLTVNGALMRKSGLEALQKCERTMTLNASEQNALSKAKHLFQAEADYYAGRQYFASRNFSEAIEHFSAANRYFKSFKTSVAIALLRIAPGLVYWLASLRKESNSGEQ